MEFLEFLENNDMRPSIFLENSRWRDIFSKSIIIQEWVSIRYRGSPHFVIFGTKRNHEIGGITNFETLLSTKSQIGSKKFLKSPFLSNFHKVSILESKHIIVRSIWICLSCYLFKFWSWGLINLWKHVVNWSKSL